MTHPLLRHAKPSPECLRKRAAFHVQSALGEIHAAMEALPDNADLREAQERLLELSIELNDGRPR